MTIRWEANSERVAISVRHITCMSIKAITAPMLIVKQFAHKYSHNHDRAACMTSIPVVWETVQRLEYVWQNGDGNVPLPSIRLPLLDCIFHAIWVAPEAGPGFTSTFEFCHISWMVDKSGCCGQRGSLASCPPLTKPPMALKFQMWTLVNQMLLFGAN